jgi:hypothetical protein
MTVLVTEAPPDPNGRARWQWAASLGDGTKKGHAYDEEEAHRRGREAERRLLIEESHDPDAVDFGGPGAS